MDLRGWPADTDAEFDDPLWRPRLRAATVLLLGLLLQELLDLVVDARQQVRIPTGVKDGQKIRIREVGGPGKHGGAPGDLYVTVHVHD
ncbi:DnaJ C-terminal domain-containing protein [Streptomyces sp. NPDC001709]